MNWKIPLAAVCMDEKEAAAVAEVLRSSWLTQGPRVEEFEKSFALALGTKHAIAVSNGTTALHLAYLAAGLNEGDEFIIPALTFVATMNAGLYLGGTPVLADCTSTDDLTISVEDVRRKISDRTRMIVTMPYGGFCPNMSALKAIADEKGIALVEDACHAPLAEIDGKKIGTFGIAGTYSFFGNKNLTTGEGGMVVTDDEEIATRVSCLRSHGMIIKSSDRYKRHTADYDVAEVGFNYRLDEIRAAIGLVQLEKLRETTALRIRAAKLLREAISLLDIDGLEIPFSTPRGFSVHHFFVILLPSGVERSQFRRRMAENGVQTSVHYPPLYSFTVTKEIFLGRTPQNLPVTKEVENRLVTLPMGPHLTEEQIKLVAESIGKSLTLSSTSR